MSYPHAPTAPYGPPVAQGPPGYYEPPPPPPAAYPPYPQYQQPPPGYQNTYYGGPPPQPQGQKPDALGVVGMLVVIADLIFGLIAAMVLTPVCGSIPIILSIVGIVIGAVEITKNKKLGAIILMMSLIFLITTLIVWFMVLTIKH